MTMQDMALDWEFTCNVCGTDNRLPSAEVGRESGRCTRCLCYARLRSMVYAVMQQFLPGTAALAKAPLSKRVRGLGCSDALRFAQPLAKVFDYTNTHLEKDPVLDLTTFEPRIHALS